MVRFFSHEQSIVIVGFHETKYLCMNATYALYLSDTINPECYINESSLLPNGSHATTYDFIKYKKDKKLYLGINCDPMLGTETNESMDETRFRRLDISENEAETVKKEIEKSGPEKHIQEKCERVYERRLTTRAKTARAKRRKLRERWCWNIDRLTKDSYRYVRQCREREGEECHNGYRDNDCVCDILSRMLLKPKRAKRKCLIEKLTKWVQNQNRTSNSKAVVEASRLLMRSYSGIARRMRLLKSKQNNKKSQHLTSTPDPDTRNDNLPCREGSSNRQGRNCRHKVIKLNSILEKYRHELIMSPDSVSVGGKLPVSTPASSSVSNDSDSASRQQKELSVLSDEFKNVLNSLTQPHRRRTKQRRKKTRKTRRLKASQTHSDFTPVFTDSRNSRKFGAESPG